VRKDNIILKIIITGVFRTILSVVSEYQFSGTRGSKLFCFAMFSKKRLLTPISSLPISKKQNY